MSEKPISQKYLSHRFTKIEERISDLKWTLQELLNRNNELLAYFVYMELMKNNPNKPYHFKEEYRIKFEKRVWELIGRFDP